MGTSAFDSIGNPSLSILTSGLGIVSPELTAIVNNAYKNNDKYKYNFELKDINLQTSTYGRVIPEIFGKMRVSGNIIWTSGIKKETSSTTVARDKFGNTSSGKTNISYSTSIAIAICKGVVKSIDNIYADNVLLNKKNLNISIYFGTEDQMPNSIIQSYEGIENVPAFRGICYILLHNFSLTEYNGRVPNFSFDVVKEKELKSANTLINGTCVIPGSGEFVYDTTIQYKLDPIYNLGVIVGYNKGVSVNYNNNTGKADSVASFQEMRNDLPNLKWVSVTCSWFASSLDIKNSTIIPKVEYHGIKTSPDEWYVGGLTREFTQIVLKDIDGNLRYGGTPSDGSILRYIDYIKSQGIKVSFYPLMMLDIPGKPWRGNVTGNIADISNFFHNKDGYRNFILHYANLLKDKIDAFIIGSEMIGLTKITDGNGNFPAVDEFCSLAQDVKNILGKNVTITYAADWSEYHHANGGWFNLDKLWSHPAIDVIGIDVYFPITNNNGSIYDIKEIKKGFESGEGYDFYYTDSANKAYPKPLSPAYAWKNIKYFWENEHWQPIGERSSWVPKMKKIWFCEYGFPSVDSCTNQPNVFYSPKSQDSGFPHLSKGEVDFKAQKCAITAFEEYWSNFDFIQQKFIWTFDARPYPFFPNLLNVWLDGDAWKYGHWINGKLSFNTIFGIIHEYCTKVGIPEESFEVNELDEYVDGFTLNQNSTAFNLVKMLAEVYDFNIYHSNGKILFSKNLDNKTIKIPSDDIIMQKKTETSELLTLNSNIALPDKIEMLFIDNKDYRINTAITKNNGDKKYTIKIPISMTANDGQIMSGRILHNILAQKDEYIISLPLHYANLNIGDILEIENSILNYVKIDSIKFDSKNNYLDIYAKSCNIEINNFKKIDAVENPINNCKIYGKTNLIISEIPSYNDNIDISKINLVCGIDGLLPDWAGCDIYYQIENNDFVFVTSVKNQSIIGKIVAIDNQNTGITKSILDTKTNITILLNDEVVITNIDRNNIGIQNLACIGNEIISFQNIHYISDKIIIISCFLRGMFQTKVSQNLLNSDFILLNENIVNIEIPISSINKNFNIISVSHGQNFIDRSVFNFNITGKYIKNMQEIENKSLYKNINGDIILSWNANNDINNDNFWSSTSIQHLFYIEIYDQKLNLIKYFDNILRNEFTLTYQKQIELFGKEIFNLTCKIFQK